MIRYAEKILIPHFERARDRLDLQADQWGLAIFDLFRAHQSDSFTKLLHQHHIRSKFVPASCTGELQPVDLSGNKQFKDGLKSRFSSWYADKITWQLLDTEENDSSNPLKVDLRLSYLKPTHAHWILESWEELKKNHDHITRGWSLAGITAAVADARGDYLLSTLKQ